MKYGLALPYNIARNGPTLARQAEDAGWDGVFLGDAVWCEDPMVVLAAAAMTTTRIRLGTMIIPVPLRRPWKIASEAVAVDRLSDGRLILGLGTGATWMGWYAFPDEVVDNRTRAEMLEETIDILTLLEQRRQFDYDGKHFHLKLTELDEGYYPPPSVQQPRVPIWIPALWPHEGSLQRALKCDGVFPEVRGLDGQPAALTPEHVRDLSAYVAARRTAETPFDIVVSGKTEEMTPTERVESLAAWADAGATWWIEELFGASTDEATDRVRQGAPHIT